MMFSKKSIGVPPTIFLSPFAFDLEIIFWAPRPPLLTDGPIAVKLFAVKTLQ